MSHPPHATHGPSGERGYKEPEVGEVWSQSITYTPERMTPVVASTGPAKHQASQCSREEGVHEPHPNCGSAVC